MSNMSYCRFENTLADLRDCYDVFEETEDLSEREAEARLSLIRLAIDIALDFGHEVGREVVEAD